MQFTSDFLSFQKLATVCTLVLDEIDLGLYDRVKVILSEGSLIVDAFLQDAALKSATVLVQKLVLSICTQVSPHLCSPISFTTIAPSLASHLRRFVTAPISTFQYDTALDVRAPLPLGTAAKTLALCIKASYIFS